MAQPQDPQQAAAPGPCYRFRGRVAIVTGSSSGFGREICRQLASEGAQLVCADLHAGSGDDEPTHELVQREFSSKAIFVKTDVSKEGDVESLIERAVAEYGKLDVMVNNAGICTEAASPVPIYESSLEVFDKHMLVNATGTLLGCKHAAKQMIQQQPSQGTAIRGHIVNVSSLGALVGIPGLACYNASKGAVLAMTKTIAADVGKLGITCNAICPGSCEGKLLDDALNGAYKSTGYDAIAAMYPMKRFGKAIDIARAVAYLASADSAWVTGIALPVDGGMSAT